MVAGTVVRFDTNQGYGFITPDEGGEDVFLHASLFDDRSKEQLRVGARVEFQAVQGDRGLKAYRATILAADPRAPGPVESSSFVGHASDQQRDDDQLVDVVPVAEFARKITDVLIEVAPDVTGAQIAKVREQMVAFARRYGWVDD